MSAASASVIAGVHYHAGEPRRQRQPPQLLALLGDTAITIDRAKLSEQRLRLTERGTRRRIKESKRRRIGNAPMREIERQTRKIGREDLRHIGGRERCRLRLVPQPIANAGLGAAGAAAALIGRRARDPHGLKPRQTRRPAHSAAPAQARNRPRCARLRW